jgi:molybdopterin-guanine dinucleotide biosynthesis protein
LIAEIDAEIARLEHARKLLSGAASPATKKKGRPAKAAKAAAKPAKAAKPVKKKWNLSPEGRARIAAATKARWAKVKVAQKAAANRHDRYGPQQP